jgi:hypothetical protein
MSFLRRIEFLEPGKNPILSDMGLSFGMDMMRIVAHILNTAGAPLVRRQCRADRHCSNFRSAALEETVRLRHSGSRTANGGRTGRCFQARQDRLLDGGRLRLRVGFVKPTSARRLTIRHSLDLDMQAAQHSAGMFINGCFSAGIEIGMRSPKIHIGTFSPAHLPDTMADPWYPAGNVQPHDYPNIFKEHGQEFHRAHSKSLSRAPRR